jgi:predicted PolB exonuclease-like 3'-5' exonuclease
MSKDPIVEEVRAIRDTYAKQFDYDTDAIYRDLKNQETQTGSKFISLPPKRIEPAKQKTA